MDSSIKALNDLFGGVPYKSDEPFILFAAAGSGKSLALFQEACYFSSKKLNVLYIDTEGSIGTFAEKWGPVFEKRFGELKGVISIKQTADLYDLCRYLGFIGKVDAIQSSAAKKKKAAQKAKDEGAEVDDNMVENIGVKQEFRVLGDIEKPDIVKDIVENKIDVVIMDSVSMPINAKFQTGVQNYPGRSDATAAILGKLMKVQIEHNVFIMATTHASTNPTNPYETHEEMKGGRGIKYFGKNVVYIDKREAREVANYRRLWGARIENKQDWSTAQVTKITDEGYVDVVQKDVVESVFTDGEKKRLTDYFAQYSV